MNTPKEDILDEANDKWHYDLGMETVTKKAALEAMEVYADQKIDEAIKVVQEVEGMGYDAAATASCLLIVAKLVQLKSKTKT